MRLGDLRSAFLSGGRIVPVSLFTLAIALRVPFALVTVSRPGFGWRWGGEMFSIAHAIVTGQGFSSPYWAATGATAQQTPGFPYFVAGLWRLGRGSMDFAAHATIWLNVLFSATTCLVLVAIGNRLWPGKGRWCGLTWAVLPVLGFTEVTYLWDTALYTLVLTSTVLLLLIAVERRSTVSGAWWGAAAGLSLLLNPSHLLVLMTFLVINAMRGDRRVRRFAMASGAGIALVVAPWIVRNSLAFDHVTFIRSNVPYEVYRGLLTRPSERERATQLNPGRNPAELARYVSLGERDYMALQGRMALDLIRHDPMVVPRRVAMRSVTYWAGSSEVMTNPWPVPMPIKHLLFLFPALAGAWGLYVLWLSPLDRAAATIFTAMVVIFPLPYYLTLTMPRYRAPIMPMLALMAVGGLVARRRATARAIREAESVVGTAGD